MGGGQSISKEQLETGIANMMVIVEAQFKGSGILPDISIDGSLNMYSGLDSTDVLQGYSSQVFSHLQSKGPDYVSNLGSALAPLTNVPNAVGIGALVISIVLDLVVSSSGREDSASPMNMIRRVFAEEKAFGVKDTMDEYIKRLRMHMRDPARALEETQRLEKQLSSALTTFRNSMLRQEEISVHEMKQWTNGAAFHAQMVIHEARLKMAGYGSRKSQDGYELGLSNDVALISTMMHDYKKDLKELLKKYYKVSDFSENISNSLFTRLEQPRELTEYFTNLKKNAKTLIMQHGSFKMPGLA